MKYVLVTIFAFLSAIVCAQKPSFEKYSVPLYRRQNAPLKIRGNALAENFKTTITDTYYSRNDMQTRHGATGLNFGGHYCFVFWGCGSPCKYSAIVDVKTGKVYEGIPASFEYKFSRNSRLIITDPDIGPEDGPYETAYWLWDDHKKHFVELQHGK